MTALYDAVIVGGSFAGLAAAQALRGHHVLLLDARPIGAHQTSTCGIPLPTMQAVGAESATLEVHDSLVLHTGGRAIHYTLPVPYATFDYQAFCQAMLAATDAAVRIARVTGVVGRSVLTAEGPIPARYVVDASGWQGLTAADDRTARARPAYGYGIETELPGRHIPGPGLHFYFDKELVPSGYAWAFGCGASTRLGICSFAPGVALGPRLAQHLERFGLQPGRTHGGVIAFGRRAPVVADRFCVGDAAGGCLPLTAEGIRTAILSGTHCGQAISAALAGLLTDRAAQVRYRRMMRVRGPYHAALRALRAIVARTPDAVLAGAGGLFAPPVLSRIILRFYLAASGGFAVAARSTPLPPRKCDSGRSIGG